MRNDDDEEEEEVKKKKKKKEKLIYDALQCDQTHPPLHLQVG